MSNMLFEAEVKQLMKLGLTKTLAIISVASKMEDKTLFNQYVDILKEENRIIEKQIEQLGFKRSDYVEPEIEPDIKQDIENSNDSIDEYFTANEDI